MSSGDFSFIDCKLTRYTFKATYDAISSIDGAWDFLKSFEPSAHNGFMFSSHPFLMKIENKSDELGAGHSGASWAITMRNMEYIAKHGWDNYVNSRL